MKKYMRELDILFSMQRYGSKILKKQDLLFPFVESDSVVIDVHILRTTANLNKDENDLVTFKNP